MHAKALRWLCVPFVVVAAALVLLAISSGDTKAQWVPGTPQFEPILDAKLCNDLNADFSGPGSLQGGGGTCTPDTSLGGHQDITIAYTVPQGHLNQAAWLGTGGANDVRLPGTAIPLGAPVGGLQSRTTLGLAANPCNNTIYPDYIWWNASIDVSDTIACQPQGTPARWSNMATDDLPDGPGPNDDFPGQADSDSPVVTKFPDCIAALFDPDRDGIDTDGNPATIGDQPVTPNWRGAGLTQVPPAGDWQMLNNIEFAPGDLQAAFSANPGTRDHPYAKLPAGLGYINVIILNEPETAVLQPDPISDFCTILGTKGMMKGNIDTDGDTVEDTPRITTSSTPGSYLSEARALSLRDADGDGLENSFDTCVWIANVDDPYQSPGADTDMLDPACDPNNAQKNDDQDGDGYVNSQDWCPLVANPIAGGGETDSENTLSYNAATATLPGGKSDGGGQGDSIGDDCDDENGGNDALSDGLYFSAISVDSVCIGATDNDQDGWCVNDGDADPYDGDDVNDTDSYNPAGAEDGIAAACANGIDDGELPGGQLPDGLVDRWDPDCNPNVADTGGIFSNRMPDATDPDGDDDAAGPPHYYQLANSNEEWCVGTDPLNDCPLISGHDTWPPDFNTDGVSNILDIVQLTPPVFNTSPPSPYYLTRKDLNCDGTINILDIVQLTPPVFNTSC